MSSSGYLLSEHLLIAMSTIFYRRTESKKERQLYCNIVRTSLKL
uniref:Uncharacterized protein n=1 Tax=Musa acuminata subsp. malaccensis TaxID=214687 RepID=A0A804J6U3_MUSAM